MKLTQLAEIAKLIEEEYDYQFLGLRIVGEGEEEVGGIAKNSFAWEDGQWTEDELDGACCLSIEFLKDGFFNKFNGYDGDRVLLIGGDDAEAGNDAGEIVIKNGVILKIF